MDVATIVADCNPGENNVVFSLRNLLLRPLPTPHHRLTILKPALAALRRSMVLCLALHRRFQAAVRAVLLEDEPEHRALAWPRSRRRRRGWVASQDCRQLARL